MSRRHGDHDVAKTLAAVLGAPIVACLVGAALVRTLPLPEGTAHAWGMHLIWPLWVCLAVMLPLIRSGRRAWIVCMCIAVPAATTLWLLRDSQATRDPLAEGEP